MARFCSLLLPFLPFYLCGMAHPPLPAVTAGAPATCRHCSLERSVLRRALDAVWNVPYRPPESFAERRKCAHAALLALHSPPHAATGAAARHLFSFNLRSASKAVALENGAF
jgi:hypothetical protein